MYAKNSEINEENRGEFYKIVDKIEKSIVQNMQTSDNKSANSVQDSFISEVADNVLNGFVINEFTAKEELKKTQEPLKNGIEFRKTDASPFEEISDLKELFSVSSGSCVNQDSDESDSVKIGKEQNDFGENEMLEESLLIEQKSSNGKNKNGKSEIAKKDEQGEDEDDYVDPLDGLSSKELRKHLPAYIFMSNKRKKKYFKSLSKNYVEKIHTRKIEKVKDKRVLFVLEDNQVAKFFKLDKIK